MRSEGVLKHFAMAFIVALVGYAFFYYVIEHRRTKNGPWEITFHSDASGIPSLTIQQPALGLRDVRVVFPGESLNSTNTSSTLAFEQARQVPFPTPFGKCVFLDTTFLPGTVTLQLFGHEIELLPRVLIIDHTEHPWKSGETINLPCQSTGAGSSQSYNKYFPRTFSKSCSAFCHPALMSLSRRPAFTASSVVSSSRRWRSLSTLNWSG